MHNKTVLISGAGIAGPALAYWLRRYGFQPTVVERTPELRDGGQAADFRGTARMTVLRRMGILDEVRRQQTERTRMVVIDGTGRPQVSLPAEFAGGEVEILRGDLARILHDRTSDSTESVFGDWITSLAESADGVRVTFEGAEPRTFDFIVGADGLHSGVRALVFGEQARFRRFLGHYVAGFSGPEDLRTPGEIRMYNEPGPELDYDRHGIAQQKKLVADIYHGMGWRAPETLDAMWAAPDFYFDPIAQIHLDRFTRGPHRPAWRRRLRRAGGRFRQDRAELLPARAGNRWRGPRPSPTGSPQNLPDGGELRQCLGVAARCVQCAHEQAAQPLAQRMCGRLGPQLSDVGFAERQLRLGPVLDRGQPRFVQPRDLLRRERLAREVHQCRATPERDRLVQQRAPIGGRAGLPRGLGEPGEAVCVDLVRVDDQPISRRVELDGPRGAGVAELPAQPAPAPATRC